MSGMPGQVNISGPVSGQIAVGSYINQFQNLNGCTITIYPPGQPLTWTRHSKPPAARPRPPRYFLDRLTEVQHLQRSIQSADPVILCGTAGIGKSTLLKQIAHLVQPSQFPDGIFWFSACSLGLEDVLQCLFSAFYTCSLPARPDRAQVETALQQVKALVILDDLELEPNELEAILDCAPGCMFVTASARQVLECGAETLPMHGLPDEAALDLFMTELGRPAGGADAALVCEISRLLKGHPGNLRWLAAAVREDGLPLDRVAETLRSTPIETFFQTSILALPERQKKLLAILAAVEGRGIPREHLAALLPAEPVQEALDDLAARNLVQSAGPAYSICGTFHGLLSRSWSLAQWERAVISYFDGWLSRTPARGQVEPVRDLLWVLVRKAARLKRWRSVIGLGRALEPLFIAAGYWQAWKEILALVLEAARTLGDRAVEGWALHQMGSRSLCLGEREQAVRMLKQAASVRQSIGDTAGLQLTQHNLSLATGIIPVAGTAGAVAAGTAGTGSMLSIVVVIGTLLAVGAGLLAAALLYTPRPPALLGPPDGYQQETTSPPALTWKSVLGGTGYQVQLDDQADFSSPVYDRTLPVPSALPDLLLAQGVYYWHVRALSRSGEAGGWSAAWQFTISTPPARPTLLQPPDRSVTLVPASLVFTWTPAEDAAAYTVQLDEAPDFSSPMEGSATAPEFRPASPLAQGAYSWRVRASNAFGTPGEWSGTYTFTVSIPPTGLILLEPVDGARFESTTQPGLKWGAVENAAAYQVQVDDSADFSSPQLDTRVPDTGLTVTGPLAQGVYTWHVRAFNTFDTPGDWSQAWSFTISLPPQPPTLLGPANGSLVTDTVTPGFAWNGVENGASYEIQVDDSPAFSSPDFTSRAADTSRRPPAALKQGNYFWRVRAYNPYDTAGGWSEAWQFILSIPPAPPTLTSPTDRLKLETPTSPTFIWQPVPNAETYQLQVDNSVLFDSPNYDTTAASTSRTSGSGFAQGIYYWRVRGFNRYNTPGQWSGNRQFTISLAPGIPEPVKPAPQATVTGPQLAFTWKGAANAAYYEVQVDNSSGFSSPEYDRTETGTTHTVQGSLSQGEYYWRVRAFNQFDTPGGWSTPPSIFVFSIPPEPVTLVEPGDGLRIESSYIPFRWNPVTNAVSYLLQVDDDPNFSSPASQPRPTTTGYNLELPPGRYYWHVQAYNIYNTPGAWSVVRMFTIPLRAPSLLAPANDVTYSYYDPPSPTFRWRGVTNAGRYQIQVASESSFKSPVIDRTTDATEYTDSSYDFTPMGDGCGYSEFDYYWRVRAIDSLSIPGLWSSVWHLKYIIDIPC